MHIHNQELVTKTANNIADIAMRINPVEIATPLNAAREQEEWPLDAQRGSFRNPIFVYQKRDFKELAEKKGLLQANFRLLCGSCYPNSNIDRAIFGILKNRIEDATLTLDFAMAIATGDQKKAAECTLRKYGKPTDEQIKNARMIANGVIELDDCPSRLTVEQMQKLKSMPLTPNDTKQWFQFTLDCYNITGWEIIIDDTATAVDVRDKTPSKQSQILIPVHRAVNGLSLVKLVGHEIECHLRNSENARQLFTDLLGKDSPFLPLVPLLAKSDNELLYEGYAKITDVAICGKEAMPKPYFTIAYELAKDGKSFSEVAQKIYEYFLAISPNQLTALRRTWRVTYRTFRGCLDTAQPNRYVFGKDYFYLAGYRLANDLTKAKHQDILDFASLTLPELNDLHDAGVFFDEPKYPQQRVADQIARRLLHQ